MQADFYKHNPFRQPQWRAERVLEMLAHRPTPLRLRRYDDHYVRAYRRFLVSYLAAGADQRQRNKAEAELPHVFAAHMLHHHPDIERRQILEALLLTQEPYAEIAKRLAADERTVDYYERLFFNVRDRLQHKDWVAKVIIGPREYLAADLRSTMTEDQRGYLYRLFAFHGGALILDTLIAGLAPDKIALCRADIAEWFDEAIAQHVRTRAAAAAMVLEVDKRNVMRVIRLALKNAAKRVGSGTQPRQADLDYLEKVAATLDQYSSTRTQP